MNEIIIAIILGIIEGLTEFLPISSTGHLIIANNYLNFEGSFANLFAVVIQVGAIAAVVIHYKSKVLPPVKDKKKLTEYVNFWLKVAVGVIPAGVLGLLFEEKIDFYLFNPLTVSIALIIGAGLIIYIENRQKEVIVTSDDQITYKRAFLVGVFQCLALIPGMSRSASTIFGGMFMGFSRKLSAEFSFFLAIPTLLGAGLLKLLKYQNPITGYQYLLLAIGTVTSFIVAYIVIAMFMNYIQRKNLKPFAYYRVILGMLVLLSLFIG